MARKRGAGRCAQAWITLNAADPEAVSAEAVARGTLAAGASLASLRRMRVLELSGKLPGREDLERLLHASTQFYNPHKEQCVLRTTAEDDVPVEAGAHLVLVWERGGERRPAAERWWQHQTGHKVEVREGVAWAVRFQKPGRAAETAADLAVLRDRSHGLLCNPHAQEYRIGGGAVPLPWWAPEPAAAGEGA